LNDREIEIKYFVIKMNQAFDMTELKLQIDLIRDEDGDYTIGRRIANALLKAMVI